LEEPARCRNQILNQGVVDQKRSSHSFAAHQNSKLDIGVSLATVYISPSDPAMNFAQQQHDFPGT
jgi:hypothetical protein